MKKYYKSTPTGQFYQLHSTYYASNNHNGNSRNSIRNIRRLITFITHRYPLTYEILLKYQ